MSHSFGDRVSQHLHRKHGLSQAKLAEGILQDPSIIGKMCKGERLHGAQARERVCAIIRWLYQETLPADVCVTAIARGQTAHRGSDGRYTAGGSGGRLGRLK